MHHHWIRVRSVAWHVRHGRDVDLELWNQLDILKKGGTDTILQKNVNLNGDVISCVGGHKVDSYGLYDIDPVMWYCKSFGGLDIVLTATEVDLEEAWDIISHIEKTQ